MLCRLVLGVLRVPSAGWGMMLTWAQCFHVKTVQPNKRPSDPHIWETVIPREVCTLQHGGAFTSNVAAPCPVPAAYKPHVPGLTSAVRKQDLSVKRKINIPYSSKHTWLRSDVKCVYSPVWLFLCF